MKKISKSLIILTASVLFVLASCGNKTPELDPNTFSKATEDLNVESISLDKDKISLEVGETDKLTASVVIKEGKTYEGGIVWRTSNPHICTVDQDGNLEAISSGYVTISAMAGYEFSICDVIVPSHDAPVTREYRVSEDSVTLKPDATRQLYAYLDGSSVSSTWTCNNPSVATVSDTGLVTAIGEGPAIVTSSYTDSATSQQYSATCTIVVDKNAEDPVEVTISQTSISMVKGGSQTLTATVNRDGATITWSSSNVDVASVDQNGVVRASGVGQCEIKATSLGVTASCAVNVKEEEDEDKNVYVYFYIDYNNVDPEDTTGTKLLASFKWYQNVPFTNAPVPPNPTTPTDPAFPYFAGWSDHTIIDSLDDLWDMNKDVVGSTYHINLYGIWLDERI